jgi:hypothetical protein
MGGEGGAPPRVSGLSYYQKSRQRRSFQFSLSAKAFLLEENNHMSLKFVPAIALVGLFGASLPVLAQTNTTGTQAEHQLNANPGVDHTLSWREVEPVAEARFKQLDADHDGTLSKQEAAKAGITLSEFEQANTKGTHTLSEQEYVGLVKNRFAAVNNNPNTDRTLSNRELNSAAGQKLLALLNIKG